MRYSEAHAAKSGSVPFALRGPKSVRTALAAAVAGAVGLVPAVAVSTPAVAADPVSDLTITAAPGAVTEGGDLVYNVKNTSTTDSVSLTISAAGSGSHAATLSSDFTASPSSLTIAAGATKQVTIRTVDDSLYEATETLTLQAALTSDPTNFYTTADGTIYDNDTAPSYTLTASPSTVTEKGSSGTITTKVTAQLSAKSGVDTKIQVTTDDGTAKAPGDYTPILDETNPDDDTYITIAAGQLSGFVNVDVKNDGVRDALPTETFKVDGTADNAAPSDQSATVGIVDAQPVPVLTLAQDPTDGVADEGNSVDYKVTASPLSELPITVRWDAVDVKPDEGDDPATPGKDFSYPSSRTLTIPAGEDDADFSVPFLDDGLNENSEQFGVALVAPTNATLDDKASKVTSTIGDVNGSAKPRVSISPTSVKEGDTGKAGKTFTATLSQKSGRAVTVNYTTIVPEVMTADLATAGRDYVTKKGTLVFPAGTLTQTFTIDVIGDTTNEGSETFTLFLSSANATADFTTDTADAQVVVTIDDDDLPPTVSFDGVTMKEGEATVPVMLQVKLSNPSTHDIKFNLTGDSASGPGYASGTFDPDIPGSGDYTLLASSVTIRAGQTVGYVPILVNGDTMFEPDESADITATADTVTHSDEYVSGTTPSKASTLKLTNDDKAPTLVLDNVDAEEGDTVDVTGTVLGTADSDMNFNVSFAGASVKGSKAADAEDFTNPGVLTATIPAGTEPGDAVTVGSVNIIDDTEPEGTETIAVSGVAASGSQGTVTPGVITIVPSDGGQNVSLSVAPSVTGGRNVPITGKVGANAAVDLWGAPISAGNVALTKLASTKANAAGAFSFSRTLTQGYRFKVASGGVTTDEKRVTVTQAPVFTVASTAKGSVTFTVQGTPRGVGQVVIVQNWVGGKWVNAWQGTTGSNNQWKSTAKVASGTALSVRAFVQGYMPNGIAGGYSETKRITVK